MKQIGLKTSITLLLTLVVSMVGSAQNGNVSIDQDKRIAQLLQIYKAVNSSANYYTVQIGFGSYDEAEELKTEADVDFPGWGSKIVFDSPTYRVHVGKFRTKLEAERKFLEVRKKYPASLLLKPEKTQYFKKKDSGE
ncbi:SPOR domain-containing protein [Muriicola sp. Z0-33]|uniref:SPOR domain-containing protein n=1 Tax=Muriicola sp. Z0-33 TaxID=2816957 RepID=UPI002236FE1E|nr:SPOR domain-containing protein [Muriicola sp. Z0-33]MCW5516265.1 SPOR domain-containing protein [Muriicola sp. Z0-33]